MDRIWLRIRNTVYLNVRFRYYLGSADPSVSNRNCQFPMESWNKYEETVLGLPRTNNASEGANLSQCHRSGSKKDQ